MLGSNQNWVHEDDGEKGKENHSIQRGSQTEGGFGEKGCGEARKNRCMKWKIRGGKVPKSFELHALSLPRNDERSFWAIFQSSIREKSERRGFCKIGRVSEFWFTRKKCVHRLILFHLHAHWENRN